MQVDTAHCGTNSQVRWVPLHYSSPRVVHCRADVAVAPETGRADRWGS